MVTQIIMNDKALKDIVEACTDYVNETEDTEEQKALYMSDIERFKNDWAIMWTGIFHDAIGEVQSCDGISIYVEDEY